MLRRMGVPPADVEDLSQEVFLVLHRRLDQLSEYSTLNAWLYSVCTRVASDRRKRAHVRREVPTDTPPDAEHGNATDDVERREGLRLLDAALDTLDTDKRAVFVLYEIEQLTMAEVAEAVGCPLQTAYSRLHAARRRVKDAIDPPTDADGAPPSNAKTGSAS